MTTANKLLSVARAEIGVKENPPGSNRVKYTLWYPMIGPWCAMFVSWCAERAGIPTSVIPKHAYTPSGANWFKQRGLWGRTPRVGAIVYYNIGGLGRISHVGIVERVYSDGSWDAIEGNTDVAGGRTGGRVMRKRRRTTGAGGGFGYPRYQSKPASGGLGTVEKPKGLVESMSKQRKVRYGKDQTIPARSKVRVRVTSDGKHKLVDAVKGKTYLGSYPVAIYRVREGQNVKAKLVVAVYENGKLVRVVESRDLPQVSFPSITNGWSEVTVSLSEKCGVNLKSGQRAEYQLQVENYSGSPVTVTSAGGSTLHD